MIIAILMYFIMLQLKIQAVPICIKVKQWEYVFNEYLKEKYFLLLLIILFLYFNMTDLMSQSVIIINSRKLFRESSIKNLENISFLFFIFSAKYEFLIIYVVLEDITKLLF